MTLPEAAIEAAKAAYLKRLNEPEEGGFGELVEAAILAALPHLGKPVAFVHASAIDEFQANSALESFEGVQTVLWTYGGKVRGKQRIPIFLAPPAPAPPEGWRAVPVEPTPEMIAAAYGNYLRGTERGNWKAMLAAAPEPPANSQGSLDGSADRESPVGWLFFNPDAGVEFSENHPIESGEVTDAENIREATSETLLEELLSAWKDWEADRQILDEYKNAADDPVKAQLVEALKEIRATIKNSEEWWMDCPNRGGFDVEKIDAALAAAEAEENKNKG